MVPILSVEGARFMPSTIQSPATPSLSAVSLPMVMAVSGGKGPGRRHSFKCLSSCTGARRLLAAVEEPTELPVILALHPLAHPCLSPTLPAQAGGSNGLLTLSPSSLLKYLSNHDVFSVREQAGEEAGGSEALARCKG